MNFLRLSRTVRPERWARYKYNLICCDGENNSRVTGCEKHVAFSRKVAGEGMVLLENNGLLPLKKGTRVSLFGVGCIDYVQGGGGSGMVYCNRVKNLYEAFLEKSPDFEVYSSSAKYYFDYLSSHQSDFDYVPFCNEIEIPDSLIDECAKNSDVAIITIHRYSTEGYDRSAEKGDFYLTDVESKMVQCVTERFSHSVVVLNVGGMVDVSWARENEKIDAVLLAWQAGIEGNGAVADILCGDVNPSGKLVDTFAQKFLDYPSADTFNESANYVNYYEDIYVGYRYFETIPNAYKKVVYPFGYGLSYTTFDFSDICATQKDGKISVSLKVTNTGAVAGKEVVQVYYSAPQGVLKKPRICLCAFKKTRLLNPNECEVISLEFDINDMASYDDLGKLKMSAYVLEKGEYSFYVGNSCRNLTKADFVYTVSDEFIVTKQLSQKCAPNSISKRMLSDGTFEELPSFPVKTYDEGVSYENTAEKVVRDRPITFDAVARGDVSIDTFLTQLSGDELIALVSGVKSRGVANTSGFGGSEKYRIPAFMTVDGPAGVRLDPKVGIGTTAWPCATLIACTFDPDLIYEVGKMGAKEAKENSLAIWLTPALNIHRNPLCGRNFEYFSEDPLISGKFAAAKVRGIQSERVSACIKHFACNNKEINRRFSDSRVSERALREIYLRGFEICVKEAQPWSIMTSYNVINSRRCCTSFEQLQGILRDEWGFKGVVTTDWEVPCDQTYCILAGNDMRMPYGDPAVLKESLENGRLTRGQLELCVKRILELFLKFE